jgi:hypothetical protein
MNNLPEVAADWARVEIMKCTDISVFKYYDLNSPCHSGLDDVKVIPCASLSTISRKRMVKLR